MEKSQIEEISLNEKIILNHKFNMYQQFFVLGLDPKIMYSINDYDLKSLQEPYSTPKVISKYPNINLPYLNIPDTIIASHCFPKGIINEIIDYTDDKDLLLKQNKTENYLFSLENMCPQIKTSSLRTKKVYYTCLLFYENIENYRNCINQRKNYKNTQDNNEVKNKGILIPKVICLSSFNLFYEQSKYILQRIRDYVNNFNYNNKSMNNLNVYPLERIIEGLIFNIPALPRGNFLLKLSNDSFSYNEHLNNKQLNDINELDTKDILFQETPPNENPRETINYSILMNYFKISDIFEIIKFIILEEPILFFSEDKKVLTNVIESLISLIYPLEYPYPVISILPEQNYSLISLFKHFIFGINYRYSEEVLNKKIVLDGIKFIRIIRLEKRFNSLLNSNEKDSLGYSIFTYIKFDENKPLIKFDQFEQNVYLNDKNETKLIHEKKKINLPRHYYEKCCRILEKNTHEKLKEIESKNKNQNIKVINKLKKNAFNKEIRDGFLYFFSCILLKYQEYCVKYEKKIYEAQDKVGNIIEKEFEERSLQLDEKYYMGNIELNDIINVEEYINSTPSLDRPFYRVFFNTKIFFNFILKKIFPESNQDKLDILFFDEIINKKLSRDLYNQKKETKFLDFELENLKSEIEIKTLKSPINKNIKLYLQKKQNRIKALNYFQYIYMRSEDTGNNNHVENEEDKIEQPYYYYFVFPMLLNDGIFYNEKYINNNKDKNISPFIEYSKASEESNKLYNLFENEAYNIIDDDDINKNYKMYDYSLNPTSQFCFKNDYLIKILWIMYISKTFKSIPFNKKRYYFEIIMSFLKKNKDVIDEDSILILFNSINKNGDRNMNQDIFPYIKNKTYISYLCAREKIKSENNFTKFIVNKKYIDNNNINNTQKNLSNLLDKKEECKNEEQNKFDKDKNILKEDKKLFFIVNSFCQAKSEKNSKIICNEPVTIKISNLDSIEGEYITFKCEKCQKEQNLKISCKYNNDNGNNKEGNYLSNYLINFELIAPMALLQKKWLKYHADINPYYICDNYLDCYLSAIFYFYEQKLPCNFLMPELCQKSELKTVKNNYYTIIKDQEFFDEKQIKKVYVKNAEIKNEEVNEEFRSDEDNKEEKNDIESGIIFIDEEENTKDEDIFEKLKDENIYDNLAQIRNSAKKQGLKSSFRKKNVNKKKKSVEFKIDMKLSNMSDEA